MSTPLTPPAPKTSLEKSRIKVVLLESIHARAVEAFRADGYTRIEQHARALPEPELIEAIKDAHIVGIRSRTQLPARVLQAAPRLITVGCFCIGTDQVDLEAARDRGIAVFNAPFSNTRSVAELVLAELILLLRGVPRRNAEAHRGVWDKSAEGSHEARGKCLGIVGYGHIGTQVGLLAEAVGMQVVFHDIEPKLSLGNATALRSLDELLERADVVTLHVPDTRLTQGLIGAPQLARMRPGAALINASRGKVVDLEALASALESGHLAGAAIDVFPAEPASAREEFVSPLRRFDNVILTPHIGGSTVEAQASIGDEVAEKLLRYSNNGSTLTSVNFPEVTLPDHEGCHRLLHIHRNQPGVLSSVNDVFSRHAINIAAQFLQTNPGIGYVVIDVEPRDHDDARALLAELDGVPGTIRTRVLF